MHLQYTCTLWLLFYISIKISLFIIIIDKNISLSYMRNSAQNCSTVNIKAYRIGIGNENTYCDEALICGWFLQGFPITYSTGCERQAVSEFPVCRPQIKLSNATRWNKQFSCKFLQDSLITFTHIYVFIYILYK